MDQERERIRMESFDTTLDNLLVTDHYWRKRIHRLKIVVAVACTIGVVTYYISLVTDPNSGQMGGGLT